MIVKANAAGVLGTGHYVPDRVVTNKELEKYVDTSDEWIQSRTGIKTRHFAEDGMNTSDMCTIAAKQALEMANLSAEDLDMIIVCTLTPDMTIPSTACIVQDNIGAKNAAVLAAQILAVSDDALAAKLDAARADMAAQIEAKEAKLQAELG